jgi:IclR family pca regulon transcriptional regulator
MTDYVRSLERGLAVIRAFSEGHPRLTVAEVARRADLSRATARRLLITLTELGYVRFRDGRYELTPRVLDLSQAYLSSLSLPGISLPHLERLVDKVNESSSVAVLDDTEIVYVARVPTKRIMTVSIGLGTRFPAFQTSMGRVLLAELEDDQIREVFRRSDRSHTTEYTVRTEEELLARIDEVRKRGWAMVDQELELGLRSVAAPLRGATGSVVAAVNVSTNVTRTPLRELKSTILPVLLETAESISRELSMRGIS